MAIMQPAQQPGEKCCRWCGQPYPAVKLCSGCGVSKPREEFTRISVSRDGLAARCKECLKVAKARDYAEHREAKKAKSRAYNAANSDKIKAQKRAAYAQQAERARERARLWHEANPERARDNRIAWAAANPLKATVSKRVAKHRRKALIHGDGGGYGPGDILALEQAQAGMCAYCGDPYGRYHIEHKQPISRGGSNTPDNLCLACAPCNLRKNDKTEAEFRAWLARRVT